MPPYKTQVVRARRILSELDARSDEGDREGGGGKEGSGGGGEGGGGGGGEVKQQC